MSAFSPEADIDRLKSAPRTGTSRCRRVGAVHRINNGLLAAVSDNSGLVVTIKIMYVTISIRIDFSDADPVYAVNLTWYIWCENNVAGHFT